MNTLKIKTSLTVAALACVGQLSALKLFTLPRTKKFTF